MPWTSPQLERRFIEHENGTLAAHDKLTYLFYSQIYFFGYLLLTIREGAVATGLLQGSIGALVWLAPLVLCVRCNGLYVRHRRLWVTVHRIANMLLVPTTDFMLRRLPAGHHLKPGAGSFASALVFGSHLSTEWTLSLGLRLELWRHLPLHSLVALRFVLVKALRFCRTPYINNPGTLERFRAAAVALTNWTGLLLGSTQSLPPDRADSVCYCYATLTAMHIVLAYFLPAVWVYIAEQRSRARFLVGASAAAGVNVQEFAEQEGVGSGEALETCTFDPFAAWMRCVALLPMLAGLTWLLALWLAAKLEF